MVLGEQRLSIILEDPEVFLAVVGQTANLISHRRVVRRLTKQAPVDSGLSVSIGDGTDREPPFRMCPHGRAAVVGSRQPGDVVRLLTLVAGVGHERLVVSQSLLRGAVGVALALDQVVAVVDGLVALGLGGCDKGRGLVRAAYVTGGCKALWPAA